MNTYSVYWSCQAYHYQVNGLLIQATQGYNWRCCHWMCVCVCVCAHACTVAQSCPTLWGPMECSLPSSCAHGIFQVRILKRDAISYSRGSSRSRDSTHISCGSGIGETPKEEHQIYHSIWLNNSFNCFFTSSYLCWWERTELQVDFERHFNTWRQLISINYLWKFISWCWI